MKKSNAAPLSRLISNLASEAVTVQKNIDAQFEEDCQRFSQLIANTPEGYQEYLWPFAPPRQRLSNFEVKARIQLQQEKTIGGSIAIGVHLLNISADLRFQRDTSQDCQLKFSIKQIPVHIE